MRCEDCPQQEGLQRDRRQFEPSEIPLGKFVDYWLRRDVRETPSAFRDAKRGCHQKILAALSSVFHTPQASGMPTNAQNSAALTSRPPLPMPNESEGVAAPVAAFFSCSFATS